MVRPPQELVIRQVLIALISAEGFPATLLEKFKEFA
jgi:hypothetical protein